MTTPLTVVTPVYGDVESFLVLRDRIRDLTTIGEGPVRYVVVDDSGGFDPQIARFDALADVDVVEAPFNLGHQRAIVYALRTIAPTVEDDDLVVTMDADGEDRPEDLPRMLAPLRDVTSDLRRIVVARRTRRRTTLGFKVMYLFFRIIFRLLTGTAVRTGNFAAYRGWVARRLPFHPAFDLSYSSAILSLRLPLTFVPCERGERYAGRSRMGLAGLFMHGLRMMMPFIDRMAMRALVLFSATLGLGIVLGLSIFSIRAFTDIAIPEWTTTALLSVAILSFVALGNFITLFTVFSQSHGITLSDLERTNAAYSRGSPSSTD